MPFPSALMRNDFSFEAYNKGFENLVLNHMQENLLGKLTSKNLHLKELVSFEEMDYFQNVEAILDQWSLGGDITFKGIVKSTIGLHEVLVKISPFTEQFYMICIVKQEDFELCCQVQER